MTFFTFQNFRIKGLERIALLGIREFALRSEISPKVEELLPEYLPLKGQQIKIGRSPITATEGRLAS